MAVFISLARVGCEPNTEAVLEESVRAIIDREDKTKVGECLQSWVHVNRRYRIRLAGDSYDEAGTFVVLWG